MIFLNNFQQKTFGIVIRQLSQALKTLSIHGCCIVRIGLSNIIYIIFLFTYVKKTDSVSLALSGSISVRK